LKTSPAHGRGRKVRGSGPAQHLVRPRQTIC
jgi:hypothetical protein